MTRTMADSANAAHLPEGQDLYLAYVDGYFTYPEAVKRFGANRVVSCSVKAGIPAVVGDVERGALTIQDAIRMRYPIVYAAESSWNSYKLAYANAGVPEPAWIIAAWGTGPTMIPGAVGHQYTNDDAAGYDLSIVADYLPGFDPVPVPPAPPTPTQEIDLDFFILQPGETIYIGGPDENTFWNAISQGTDTSIEVFTYETSGAPIATSGVIALKGNQPNVSGPNQANGSAGALGAKGACSLGFTAGTGGAVGVSIHGL